MSDSIEQDNIWITTQSFSYNLEIEMELSFFPSGNCVAALQ